MNRPNTYRKFIQITSFLMMIMLVTPIVLKSAINDEQYKCLIFENHQSKEQNSGNESEDEKNKNSEEFYCYERINLTNGFRIIERKYFSNNHSFCSLYKEVHIPPPE